MTANSTGSISYLGLFVLLALVFAGCGHLSSGKWEDDPKNWERAWGNSKPDDIIMVHSWYYRSAHWTREEVYYFQFKWHEELFQRFIDANGMRKQIGGLEEKRNPTSFCLGKPAWFIPKPGPAYDLWECPPPDPDWDAPCLLFRDKATNEIFLYTCRL